MLAVAEVDPSAIELISGDASVSGGESRSDAAELGALTTPLLSTTPSGLSLDGLVPLRTCATGLYLDEFVDRPVGKIVALCVDVVSKFLLQVRNDSRDLDG
jgi:hypothetical protein